MTNFSEKDKKFLLEEFGVTALSVERMDYDKMAALQDRCFEIEGAEAADAYAEGDRDLSERGETAVRLVDLLGSVLDGLRFADRGLTA